MSDAPITPAAPTVLAPPPAPSAGGGQPNGAGSVLVGTSGAAVLAWAYQKLSHDPNPMPADVAMQMTGLMIVAMHGIQTAALWWLNRKKT